MQPELKPFKDAWSKWAVDGEIIQIRQESSILFRPKVSTRPFWLYLGVGGAAKQGVGQVSLVIHSAVFNCQRLFARRGEEIKVPVLEYHEDEMEKARGRLLVPASEDQPFVLDLGFPVVVDQLEKCPEVRRAQEGDIFEVELVPPMKAYIL